MLQRAAVQGQFTDLCSLVDSITYSPKHRKVAAPLLGERTLSVTYTWAYSYQPWNKYLVSLFDFRELGNLILTCFGRGQFGLLVCPSRLTQHTAWASISMPTPEFQYCAVSNLWTLDPYGRGRCVAQRHTGQGDTHPLVWIYSLPSVPTQ